MNKFIIDAILLLLNAFLLFLSGNEDKTEFEKIANTMSFIAIIFMTILLYMGTIR